MHLLYYNKINNFGDVLNKVLWEDIFSGIVSAELKSQDSTCFCGIGTILTDAFLNSYKEYERYIIWGSGIRDLFFKYDDRFEFWFVRGPITAKCLGISEDKAISDAAYCLPFSKKFEKVTNLPKEFDFSFMPHYSSLENVNWKYICNNLGINFISPLEPIDEIIIKISKSEYVMSQAMHGAIVADILRIPWHRIKLSSNWSESDLVSELKWTDWISSINCKSQYTTISIINDNGSLLSHKLKGIIKHKLILSDFENIIRHKGEFQLSEEFIFNKILDRLKEKIFSFKRTYQ